MPEEISPEEKLLRLIKGDKQIAGSKPEPASNNNYAKKIDHKITASKKEKDNGTDKNNKGDDKDKKTAVPQSVQPAKESPIDKEIRKQLAQDKSLKAFKTSIEKKQPAATEIKSESDQKTKKEKKISAVRKTMPTAKKTETTAKPTHQQDKSQAQQPDNKTAQTAQTEDKHTKPSVNIFIHAFRFIVSGFGIICWGLLIILMLSIAATVWHIHNISLREYTVADISQIKPARSESPAPEEDMKLPQPFPYFAEQISRKQLFKLVKPPPPPKPPEPKKKKPEKPTVKIETLTRHFVLQGIVYDIGPPQAIIFNKKENKTMFLGNKEMLTDKVKIKKILRGKVILEYEDQTQEMTF